VKFQFGYGNSGSAANSWSTWTDATYVNEDGNNDRYKYDWLIPPKANNQSYAWRASGDGGATWTYCGTAATQAGTATTGWGALTNSCLLMTEYVEGPSNNKALEFKNCGANSIDMTTLRFCQTSNANTTCTTGVTALTGTLAAGSVYVAANNSWADPGYTLASAQLSSGGVSFNGNDRIALYRDVNGTAGYQPSSTDILIDAFGDLDNGDPGNIWENKVYRRANCTRYDGVSAFAESNYFSAPVAYTVASLSAGAPVAGVSNIGLSSLTCP
jgi:hypothetical protein